MSDYVIDNQPAAGVRQELNSTLDAIVRQNAGETEPPTTFPNMIWVDTAPATPILKIRNASNTDWISIGSLATVFELANTTSFARGLLQASTAIAVRALLELGSVATYSVGTGSSQIMTRSQADSRYDARYSSLGNRSWANVNANWGTWYRNSSDDDQWIAAWGNRASATSTTYRLIMGNSASGGLTIDEDGAGDKDNFFKVSGVIPPGKYWRVTRSNSLGGLTVRRLSA